MGALKTYLTWKYLFVPAMFFLLFLVIAMGKGVSKEGFYQPMSAAQLTDDSDDDSVDSYSDDDDNKYGPGSSLLYY
jgi:hypothetical protein